MNDVLQYLASSGAEEEAEKQLGLQSNPTIAQDLQIRSIRETLAEKQKARHDEFLQKLVQQANLVGRLFCCGVGDDVLKHRLLLQVNVDVLAQEKQLAELEALEQQLRVRPQHVTYHICLPSAHAIVSAGRATGVRDGETSDRRRG